MKSNDQSKVQKPPPQKGVGQLNDAKTGQSIPIVPRKGETPSHAIDRTQTKHGQS